MFKLFKRNSFFKIIKDGIFSPPYRLHSVKVEPELSKEKILTFRQELQQRYSQANRTVLVQVNQPQECYDLYDYISEVGNIQIMYHYETKQHAHFALIEMEDANSILDIFNNAKMKNTIIGMPNSNFLSFEKPNNNKVKLSFNKDKLQDKILLNTPIYLKSDSPSFNFFEDVKLFSERLQLYYNQSKIDDLSCRLRFLTAKQLEYSVRILNQTINVLPVGSSMSGFGTKKSDLDLVGIPKVNNRESRLIFHMKPRNNVEASHIHIVDKLVEYVLPGCYSDKNQKISKESTVLNFSNEFTSLNCTFTLYNNEAFAMTELLHLTSSIDFRIKLLAFLIQRWGNVMSLTKKLIYEKCISNHTLLLLMLYFLQQKHSDNPSLLLPLERLGLKKSQTVSTNEKYLAQLSLFTSHARKNKQSVEELAFLFFQFYSNFNFDRYGISIRTGGTVNKIGSFADGLFVENPFQSDINLSPNVRSKEVKRFLECVRDTHQKLDASFKSDLLREMKAENPRSIRN